MAQKLQCDKCEYRGEKLALRVHRSKTHRDSARNKQICKEVSDGEPCTETFWSVIGLREHLAKRHGIDAATHSLTEEFNSVDEFQAWKAQYEAANGVVYNIASSRPRSGTTARYLCSRSGVYAPAGTGKRRLKSQGTCKLGCRCTSDVVATTREDGTVLVKVHPFHYGHPTDMSNIPHVRIPKLHKAAIKEKLLNDVPMSRIIKDVRETFGRDAAAGTSASRTYWLQRRDLHNMCRSVGVTAASLGEHLRVTRGGCTRKTALELRTSGGISTNIHVKAFQRVLKYQHLNGKMNKRVDE
ncbi:uncharacterized protein LOC119090104 [Pollicipes pollicipes]|uniref:uncharacterized protein LOC119090104 n=1 Tax=Pollicipes pollicipes TaxID=41117 RepID=UPI0018857D80|nr:uncharacterized protein LOC119090104 [Pollicipes pollicipes]